MRSRASHSRRIAAKTQAKPGRHKCLGCARDRGREHGRTGQARHLDFESLPKSQAGPGRHKDVLVAYNLGYDELGPAELDRSPPRPR
jgi:hypothetical protein